MSVEPKRAQIINCSFGGGTPWENPTLDNYSCVLLMPTSYPTCEFRGDSKWHETEPLNLNP